MKYKKGDVIKASKEKICNVIIPHICNDIKKWGAGFVLAISKEWKKPEQLFRSTNLKLGEVQFIQVTNKIIIANMIAQHGIRHKNNKTPIRYDNLRSALIKVNKKAIKTNSIIMAPKFGSGLAGGNWNFIEQIIKDEIKVETIIYNF